MEVVNRFEANGLYSPAAMAVGAGMLLVAETTSKDEGAAGAMTSDDVEVKETIEPIDVGIRWPGCDGIMGKTDG